MSTQRSRLKGQGQEQGDNQSSALQFQQHWNKKRLSMRIIPSHHRDSNLRLRSSMLHLKHLQKLSRTHHCRKQRHRSQDVLPTLPLTMDLDPAVRILCSLFVAIESPLHLGSIINLPVLHLRTKDSRALELEQNVRELDLLLFDLCKVSMVLLIFHSCNWKQGCLL